MSRPDDALHAMVREQLPPESDLDVSVLRSAIEHRVGWLFTTRAVKLPTHVGVQLLAHQAASAAHTRKLNDALSTVHDILGRCGVDHLIIKGYVSATRWFDRPEHRPYADIDIVVKPDALALAVRGLAPKHPQLAHLETAGGRYITSVDVVWDGIHVDLQTDPLRTGLPLAEPEQWVGTCEIELPNGAKAKVLDPEHDLVAFLLHQGRDRFRYLIGVEEAKRRIARPICWERVESIARQERIWDQVAVSLEVMCDEIDADLPVMKLRSWRASLWRWLWRPKVRLLGDAGVIRHVTRSEWLMPLTMPGRFREAIGWIGRSAFPPDDVLRLKYPSAKGPYIWRAVASRAGVIIDRRLETIHNRRDKKMGPQERRPEIGPPFD